MSSARWLREGREQRRDLGEGLIGGVDVEEPGHRRAILVRLRRTAGGQCGGRVPSTSNREAGGGGRWTWVSTGARALIGGGSGGLGGAIATALTGEARAWRWSPARPTGSRRPP